MNEPKDEVISLRFTKSHFEAIKKISDDNKSTPTKTAEDIIIEYLEVFSKCWNRRDLIIQRKEIKQFYEKMSVEELDPWIEQKYLDTVSCMKIFSPMLQYQEMCKVMIMWFKQNSHHLHTEDHDGIRSFMCIGSDMGKNWNYCLGKVYYRMFNEANFAATEFNSDIDGFTFKTEIPRN